MSPSNSLGADFLVEQLESLGVKITRLVTDSRIVQRGDTFVAYPGESSDGRQHIAQAIALGANAVIYEETLAGHEAQHFAWNPDWVVPHLAVADLRHKAGWLADHVYAAPSEDLWMIGITGTNGKTSTSHWIAHALSDAGKKCALIGTLGNGFTGALQPTANTTPDAVRVHSLMADYSRQEAAAVAMEVSSHALAQGRVNGVRFDVALLTNLSRDHLDYHGDMSSYAASKRKLFDWDSLKCAVLNLDDAFGIELAEQLRDVDVEVVGYGMSDASLQLAEHLGIRMVYGHLLEMSGRGLRLDVHSSWGGALLNSALIGRFNAANLLGALAALLVSEVALEQAVQSLSAVQAVPGRMQRFGGEQQPVVVVDYAHTPDALEKVLLALREVSATAGGSLICVFGCGGDRDRGKRPMMGLVAERFADRCIVTSDNPRGEDPLSIVADVLGGMSAGQHQVIIDRRQAIESAISRAQSCDTVLVAGKGHEDYQEINGVKHPFSDVRVVQQALQHWREARA
ncbi:MAG: UDP-N-acetylmuramoyl-L-alanyl-D-glutamate--2,6-diaminopimelate ligase [Nitrosomonadales bacterium]|nr:UDP-N-acetylmuramoyl-L-alanyl-D-glutamate--2,6-diaminopimelate ligase [Nitrosomonadales bacterium]